MIYLVFGQEKFLVDATINKVSKDIKKDEEAEIIKFDFKENSLEEILEECNTFDLFMSKKILILKNAFFIENKKEKIAFNNNYDDLISYFDNENVSTSLIISFYGEKISSSSKVGKYILKNKDNKFKIFECKPIKDNEWPIFIKQKFDKKGIKIDSDALKEFTLRINCNLDLFSNEFNKIINYKNDHITIEDVKALTIRPLEEDGFSIVNNLMSNKNDLAILAFRDLKFNNKINDPVQFIMILTNSLLFLKKVSILNDLEFSFDDISKKLNANPYRVKIALSNLRKFNKNNIDKMLYELYILDKKIKTSEIDKDYGFELFLTNFNTK